MTERTDRALPEEEHPEAWPQGAPPEGPLSQGALCWGQQWPWNEQQRPAERHSPTLLLEGRLEFPDLDLGLADVRSALRTLVERHQSLRTTFGIEGGRPAQFLWPPDADMFELVDAGDRLDDADPTHTALDIGKRWPLRIFFGRTGSTGTGLRVIVHHIAADRFGFDMLAMDLRAIIEASARGEAPDLPPAGRQPLELAAFERSAKGRAVNERAMRHWLNRRDDLETVLGRMRAGFDEPDHSMHVFRASSKTAAAAFERVAAAKHASRAAVAVAAVSRTLARALGNGTVPMYMLVHNRHLPGLKRSVASVVQAGLVAVDAEPDRPFADTVPAAMRAVLAAMRHAHYDGADLTALTADFEGFAVDSAVSIPSIDFIYGAAPPATETEAEETRDGHLLLQRWARHRPCLGPNFHFYSTDDDLTIELRVGFHLMSEDGGWALLSSVLDHPLAADPK